MKEKISNDLSYIKAGYRSDKWKWVLSLSQNSASLPVTKAKVKVHTTPDEDSGGTGEAPAEDEPPVQKESPANSEISQPEDVSFPKIFKEEQITFEHIMKTFGLDKPPKNLPCPKKCSNNPWCLAELKSGAGKEKARPTDQPRDPTKPVGLQNTANTCWINSALQALFHLPKFRNVINNIGGFAGEESLSTMLYLLQAIFVEMDTHPNKAIACSPGSLFEKIGMFATQEIMRKDADHEVLKCVSEFLENTIDTLIADPRLGPELSPLFSTSLMRLARWKCPVCKIDHESQLAPATSYTMAAYVSADECPLDQCLVDLQTETQTGVSLICGSESSGSGGCGAQVKVDRVVTPKIQGLPTILVIRNNSLMDRDLKRRLHVVYPETLDLTSHTLSHIAATYTLSAVIFHHGHWVKHFSAHVRTNGNKWYNFNDEQVSELTNRSTTGNPSESHRNYFSIANVANKYKHRPGLRVSRGSFVWVYVLSPTAEEESVTTPPPEAVVEYVLRKQEESMTVNHQLQAEIKREKEALLGQLAVTDILEDYELISESLLSAWFNCDDLEYKPQPSLLAQPLCEHKLFSPRKFHLLKCIRKESLQSLLNDRCGIHQDEALKKLALPISMSTDSGCCRQCLAKAVNHILFIERVKSLHKQAKKDARKPHEGPTVVLGLETLEYWPRLALSAYVKENGIDTEEEDSENSLETSKKTDELTKSSSNSVSGSSGVHVNGDKCDNGEVKSEVEDKDVASSCDTSSSVPENDDFACDNRTGNAEAERDQVDDDKSKLDTCSEVKDASVSKAKDTKETVTNELTLFNEDLVCQHNLLSPTVGSCRIPKVLATEIIELCGESVHPAFFQDDFSTCPDCGAKLEESVRACDSGRQQKKQLSNLFQERKRPHPMRDPGKQVYAVSREFIVKWKSYIRSCERGDLEVCPLTKLENSSLLCTHGHLLFPVFSLQPHQLSEYLVLVWEEEWQILSAIYSPDHVITAVYNESAILITEPGVCESGCVEVRAAQDYEDQFSYECEIIHVRQVNSVTDIPKRSGRTRGGAAAAAQAGTNVAPAAVNNESIGPRKKPRLAAQSGSGGAGAGAGAGSTGASNSHRLVRASKTFSSSDTLREVQNFIAERTGIWPMLQTLWVCGESQEGDDGLIQITDDHRAMTLNALRVRPGDTIYFRAAVEDMQLAAGDGMVEFNEMEEDW